ncbi:carnitine 3-dehydrogenase [uncultured Candidatus Puniceispirillum sp.]|uniref:carnitine 3-dehydrogenase n=1 Tax=uncultured Candidatus Puniceispirillum sp. TaxID=1985115 RepID=UPI0032B10425
MSKDKLQKAAVIGGGVIGGGWVARLVQNGVDTVIFDHDPEAPRKIDTIMLNADHAVPRLTMAPLGTRGSLRFASTLAEAVINAEFIVEAVPERLDTKQAVYADIEAHTSDDVIIASSTSGIMPTDLQAKMRVPGRLIVGHPFNPVYLLPLVEIVAGDQTATTSINRASDIYTSIGMHPLHVRKEIPAFIADRFLEAVWREALWLINDGVATTDEIDDAIRYGFGLRWAQMGLFETYRVAGGEAGMKHFMAQFGPCLKWPWTKLMDVPELTDELVETISKQSDAQSGSHSIRELERIRDNNLVSILQALKANNWGAGQTIASWEARLFAADDAKTPTDIDVSQPIRTLERQIPDSWTDYNGHMNEARYLDCFSQASDTLLRMIGVTPEYVEAGGSYFTVETHIRHLDEVTAQEHIHATTQVIHGEGKKLHLFHSLMHEDGRLLATGEHLFLHVDMNSRASSLPEPSVAEALAKIAAAHAKLPLPNGSGRAIKST